MDCKIIRVSSNFSSLSEQTFCYLTTYNSEENNQLIQKEQTQSTLVECLNSAKLNSVVESLSITNNDFLTNAPNWKVSKSHTNNASTAIISSSPKVKSIGIDIEFSKRKIDAKTQKYFLNNFDQNSEDTGTNLLQLWVKKEACFKAWAPHCSKETFSPPLLKSIWIKGNKFGDNSSNECKGFVNLQSIPSEFGDIYLSIAYLKNDSIND